MLLRFRELNQIKDLAPTIPEELVNTCIEIAIDLEVEGKRQECRVNIAKVLEEISRITITPP